MNKIVLTLILIPLLLYIIPTAFNFFGVKQRAYFIYIVWLIALLILNAILPSRVPNMFEKVQL